MMADRRRYRPARVAGVAITVVTATLLFRGVCAKPDVPPDRAQDAGVRRYVPPNAVPAAASVVALLAGLAVGDTVGGAKVLAMIGPTDRVVTVVCESNGTVFDVMLMQRGTGKAPPPITLDKYEVAWGGLRGAQLSSPEVPMRAAQEIADRVRRMEHQVPVPEGM